MKEQKIAVKFPTELRYDVVSKDWVVIATGRAKRPEMFKKEKRKKQIISKKDCPFCDIGKQLPPTLIMVKGKVYKGNQIPKDWSLVVIPNKYPAFIPYERIKIEKEGPFYHKIPAVGFHEVVVTKSHLKQLAQFSIEQIKEVIDAYHFRYLELKSKKFVNHIFIFHNHGEEAGASIAHPHSQIATTLLIDRDLQKALLNSKRYFRKHKKCIYCEMNKWERKQKVRIVFENRSFLALCPFASKIAFEVIISPKKHRPYFEEIKDKEKWELAEAFKIVLAKLFKGLGDPSYNFYLHTSPCDGKKYPYYHWHFTILPKTSIPAGFELSAGMEISTIEPEKAAEYLRKIKVKP
jgi:UDPglucose--hexose-1-phosphate uridylyltransferase